MSAEPLITKYRPNNFDAIVGHKDVKAKLQRRLANGNPPHSYLLTGPSGVGKTTIARIIGKQLEAEIIEVDAGSAGSIDSMRELIDHGQHYSLSGASRKMFIIDECHGLSAPAKQAILKILEEPPEHLYFALCTTELHRIPETWLTRCFPVGLNAIEESSEIESLLEWICDCEGWEVAPNVFNAIVQGATGQPRKAITYLERLYDVTDIREAHRVMGILDAKDSAVIELAQLLINGQKNWDLVRPALANIADSEFEGAIVHMTRYIMGAMIKESSANKAAHMAQMIDALTFPCQTFDPKAQFYAAIKRILWP